MEEGGIDFVLMWVDGSDPEWRALKDRYDTERKRAAPGDADANGECRYRDYGMLRYWFRAVERFAPWMGRVFFVTCGQKPDWLDESNPKLRLVNHADFIPAEYLPTFQANTIEMNLHRIKDLSERFVLFNDDMFLLRPVDPGLFFSNGLPVIPCDLAVPRWIGCSNTSRLVLNDAGVLKMSMDVEAQVRKNLPERLCDLCKTVIRVFHRTIVIEAKLLTFLPSHNFARLVEILFAKRHVSAHAFFVGRPETP